MLYGLSARVWRMPSWMWSDQAYPLWYEFRYSTLLREPSGAPSEPAAPVVECAVPGTSDGMAQAGAGPDGRAPPGRVNGAGADARHSSRSTAASRNGRRRNWARTGVRAGVRRGARRGGRAGGNRLVCMRGDRRKAVVRGRAGTPGLAGSGRLGPGHVRSGRIGTCQQGDGLAGGSAGVCLTAQFAVLPP